MNKTVLAICSLLSLIFVLVIFNFRSVTSSEEHLNKEINSVASKVEIDKVKNSDEKLFILHFVLRGVSLETARWLAERAKYYGYNSLQIQITDGVVLDRSPWGAFKGAWTKDEFIEYVAFVKDLDLKLIPEVKLFSHQEKFLKKKYPQYMHNSGTYNPESTQLYNEIVFPLIDELIEIIQPEIFHVAHDEVAGHNQKTKEKWLNENEFIAPASLYLQSILNLNQYINDKGLTMAIWGDMLLSQSEFPQMFKNHLHGNADGYGVELRKFIPKNVIVTDWQYFGRQKEFKSTKTFISEGFTVLPATWKSKKVIDNFTNYAYENNTAGMITTTWWHVQKNEWEKVEEIMENSSNAFKKTFGAQE